MPFSATSLGREGVGVRGCYKPQPVKTPENLPSELCDKTIRHLIIEQAHYRAQEIPLVQVFGVLRTVDETARRGNIRRMHQGMV